MTQTLPVDVPDVDVSVLQAAVTSLVYQAESQRELSDAINLLKQRTEQTLSAIRKLPSIPLPCLDGAQRCLEGLQGMVESFGKCQDASSIFLNELRQLVRAEEDRRDLSDCISQSM